MKKIFKNALLFAATATLSTGVTSCSDDDDKAFSPIEAQNKAIQEITDEYLDDVVFPTYTSLANESDHLYQLISSLKSKLEKGTQVQQSEIDAICTSYKAARKYWEASESFLYGAASDFEIDPHIDTWPLDVASLAKDLDDDTKITGLNTAATNGKAREYVSEENLGFHGLEFIFFRDGRNRDVAIFNNDVTEDYTYKGEEFFKNYTVTGQQEVIFAAAIACDLRDKCYQLEVSWKGTEAVKAHRDRVAECAKTYDDFDTTVKKNGLSYGADMLAASTSTSTIGSWKKVIETILVSGCSNICAEVADQKMGQAYRAAIGKPEKHEDEETGEMVEDDPNYIESPYSYNSFTDFYDNIMSIQNSLYNNIGATSGKWDNKSIMSYLTTYNVAMATDLNNKLQAALLALNTCKRGKVFVLDPGSTNVKAAMDAIGELDEALNSTSKWILAN